MRLQQYDDNNVRFNICACRANKSNSLVCYKFSMVFWLFGSIQLDLSYWPLCRPSHFDLLVFSFRKMDEQITNARQCTYSELKPLILFALTSFLSCVFVNLLFSFNYLSRTQYCMKAASQSYYHRNIQIKIHIKFYEQTMAQVNLDCKCLLFLFSFPLFTFSLSVFFLRCFFFQIWCVMLLNRTL